MARHFLSHLVLDLQDEDPITGETQAEQAERSPEEDAQAATEATTELSEAVAASDDVDRFSDVADALEDAGVILDSVQEADPAHVALAQTITNMAVAGQPDMDGSDIAPSLESYVGRRLSTEGFKDAAKRIWETIKRWVKKIWAKIEGFFYKHFGRIPRMRKSLAAAEAQLAAAESKPKEDKKITLTSGLSQMVIGNVEVKDFGKYVSSLASMVAVTSDVFKIAGTKLANGGDKLAEALGDFEASEGRASLNRVVEAMQQSVTAPNSLKSFNANSAPGHTDGQGLKSSYTPPLPGNITLRSSYATITSANAAESTGLASLSHLQRSIGVCAVYPDKAKDTPSTISIDTPAIDQVRAAIGHCKRMLDDMETFYRGKAFKDLKEAQDKITKAGDKIASSVSKVKPEDLKEGDLSYFRQASGVASTYVQSALKTFAGISTTAMTSASFVCVVASKTSSAYRNK